jgi:hypothetical protein
MTTTPISATHLVNPIITVSLALEELDKLRVSGGCLPTPEALLGALLDRETDFNLLAGAVRVYLRAREVPNV